MSNQQSFDYQFTVPVPLEAVAAFHHDTRALPHLTPPPIRVQLHRVDPLAEGAIADFTLWFGPVPVRWVALHTQVDPLHGFTDTQQAGPLLFWRHTHRFDAIDAATTRVREHIEYQYKPGWRGWFSRVLYNPLALSFLFGYRRWVTRRSLRVEQPRSPVHAGAPR
jgi:ligand-binding SRPBCC domain-containing protein